MRDLVYYIATTLDGFIARPEGSFEDFPWNDEFIAELATDLFEARLVDEVILKLNPIIFGTGIPLFSRSLKALKAHSLKLVKSRAYQSGHVLLSYSVRN